MTNKNNIGSRHKKTRRRRVSYTHTETNTRRITQFARSGNFTMLQQHEIKKIESDIFARHRLNIGNIEVFTVKLTPKDDLPAFSQSWPTLNNLKEDILVEVASLYKYGIITTLPISKYASPIFAQKKKQSVPWRRPRNIWPERNFSVNLTVHWTTIVSAMAEPNNGGA